MEAKHCLKVIIISPTESVLTKRGNRHPILASKLTECGHEVLYLSTNFYHAEKRELSTKEIDSVKDSTPYDIKFFSTIPYNSNISASRFLGNIKVALAMFVHLLRKGKEGDILLVPSRPPEFVFIANLIRLLKGVKVIFDVRDVWPDGLPLTKSLSHKLFYYYCNTLYFLSAKHGQHYTYTAPGFLSWIKKYNNKNRATFIPIGFDEDRWTICQPLRLSDIQTTIKLVYLGDLAKSMDILPLFHAIANNTKFSLTFIGGGEQLDDLKAQASQVGATNIHFRGFIPKEEVVAALQQMHITVIPMKVKYVMPNKLFDALGSFRPILVLGKNDASEFVNSNSIGWSYPFDHNKITLFLQGLAKEDIVEKSKNIAKIRSLYSKNSLYKQFIHLIIK